MRRRRTAQNQGSNVKPLRVVLLGKDGVGKSALTVRFMTRRFIGEYDQTLESTYRHMLQIENEDITIDIMDTAGENTDVKIRRSTRRGDLFIILYSIVDRSSFDEAQSIARYIKDHRSNVESMSIVIVATKKDLDHLRRVDIEEGIALSNEVECTFYEVSISEGYNEVHDLLKELLKRVLMHRTIDKRDTLKIPTLGLRRSPSMEKRKRAQSFPDKTDAVMRDMRNSPETQRKDYVECQLKPSKSIRDLNEENGSKHKFMTRSSPITQRKKNPFFVEKGKGVAAEKLDEENKNNSQKMFTLQRVKSGNPAGHRDQACGIESPDANNNEDKKQATERNTEKPKGPFSLNKAHDRPTTSFGRMRFGLERTFGRKKYVYNL
ncbi:GTP-binding protein Rit1 isoform X1 [Exaiptasia diaphana]|uniref:small monomeric GTPase n=1 Tax=Exaiptasia diaphana TaxID=2652724 RepID=A0A913WP99_EXADI|nr:GTP-binding protein Rit1 isoform X1 [Exaiptasia diaphana]XP_020892006.1 GTP-binding protein Rit1 isoform X1 [Exaiptasia diaphana]XP_020892007.1 GTP-binding protein Rit1 isoform X2 [Exaiptasia diaphana]XP_028512541.1 GTP-binding protein Rit1 isoform X1 [Exaiptasia diaphana]XP_028512542.1 GTP-binding protein Rit1 isoform X1 [Exaiptasia diaphana]KXJ19060.1 Ras-related and estrogen-regulated growth inhibitor [Exaiptasia diaphana]